MSNYKALATVTATLSKLVQEAINSQIGAQQMNNPTVSHLRPDASGLPTTGVNIFLYQVTTNPAWRNVDLPARNADGQLVTRPRVALDLHYLLSFYGSDTTLEPQQLLGQTVSALHAKPVLTRTQVKQAIEDVANLYLDKSDLADEVELVKFTPLPLSLEELSKLWSVFFQTQYTLSIAYHATVVLLDSNLVPVTPLPVRARTFASIPYKTIEVERIAASTGVFDPILDTSTISITGKGLQGDTTKVVIAGADVDPTSVSEKEILVPISAIPSGSRRAGIQGLQVVHKVLMGEEGSETLHNGIESSIVPFVLRPRIVGAIAKDTTTDPTKTTFSITVSPQVSKTQRVLVHLNQKTASDPASYSYEVPLTADTSVITLTFKNSDISAIPVPAGKVAAGTYLVRVQIDGAETLLETDSSGYSGPTIVL